MAALSSVAIVLAGIVIGVLLGLTGGGGSILTVPLLVYIVGLEPKIAIATSLLVVGLASLAALLPHSRAGNVYWKTGIIFGLAGMAGAYAGGRIAQYLADAVLLVAFAVVMIGSGLAMIRKRACDADGVATLQQARNWTKVVADGFVVGIVTGLVGAGGGFLVVPALALLGGLPMHAAVGTSLLVISLKCFAGLAGYAAHVPIDLSAALVVSAFAICGTLLGGRLSGRIPAAQLRRGFGVFVLVIASILIVVEGSVLLASALGIDRLVAAGALLVVEALVAAALALHRTGSGEHVSAS